MDDGLKLGARLLLAGLFVAGAAQKLLQPEVVEGLLAGIGMPGWLVWPALLFNTLAAGALLLGMAVRPVALALAAYCGMTSLFHFIPGDGWQMSIFVKNWAIAGGLLALASAGPGRFALGRRGRMQGTRHRDLRGAGPNGQRGACTDDGREPPGL